MRINQTTRHLGREAGQQVWLGSRFLFQGTVPAGIGVTEEHMENQAGRTWPSPQELATDKLTP